MKKYSLLLTGLVLSSISMGSVAFGQEALPSYTLDEITVTATRSAQTVKGAPASVSIVTGEDIQKHDFKTVAEALQYLPGVYLDQTSQGGIKVRGFSGSDLLVLLDGMPMNTTYNNEVEWEMLPIHNIQKIEVVRGASSSLYGGHAVGGVIQIFTKKASQQDVDGRPVREQAKSIHGEAFISFGSHNSKTGSITVRSPLGDNIDGAFTYSKRKSDGFKGYYYTTKARTIDEKTKELITPDHIPPQLTNGNYILGGRGDRSWDIENISAVLNYHIDDAKTLTYHYAHTTSTYDYNHPFTTVYKDGKPVFSGNIKVDDTQYISQGTGRYLGYDGLKITELNQLSYKDTAQDISASLGYLNMKANGYSSPNDDTDINWTGAGDYSYYPGKTYDFTIQKTWHQNGNSRFLGGLIYKQESFNQKRQFLTSWRDQDSIDTTKGKDGMYAAFGGKNKNFAIYGQEEYRATDNLTIYGGLRWDHYKKVDGFATYFNENTGAIDRHLNYPNVTYNELSPKLSLEYALDKDTNMYLSYGHSFNPPALYRIFRDGGSGMGQVRANPDLEPERSDTYEFGIKHNLDADTLVSLALYKVHTKDKVDYVYHYSLNEKTKKKQLQYKQYENVGTEDRKGFEISVQRQFSPYLSAYANYAWEEGKLKTTAIANTNVSDSNVIDYDIPEHTFHGGLAYDRHQWGATLDMQYISARQSVDKDTGEYGSNDPYFLMNTAFYYHINEDATLQFAINNLLNRAFYNKEATDGRNYNLSMRYKF